MAWLVLAALCVPGWAQAANVTGAYGSYKGFWPASTATASSNVRPDQSNELYGFTAGGVTYSTGVDDARLTQNGIAFTPQRFQALPVPTAIPVSSSSLIGIGANWGGAVQGASGVVPTTKRPASYYMTDGGRGLELATAIFNLPAPQVLVTMIDGSAIDPAFLNDAIPDFLFTQMGQPGGTDTVQFFGDGDTPLGVPLSVNFASVPVIGWHKWSFYNANTFAASAGTNGDRETRLLSLTFADLGITNVAQARLIRTLRIRQGGFADYAFIAYNEGSVTVNPLQLVLTKVANATNPSPLRPGGNASYTLEVSNQSTLPSTSTGTITVTDTLPAGLVFSSASGTGWACSANGQLVTCTTNQALGMGAKTSPLTITATVQLGAPATVTNTATLSGGGDAACPSATRCTASVSAAVAVPALSLSKSVSAAYPAPRWHGGVAAFDLTVSNLATALTPTVGAVVVTDVLPDGLQYSGFDSLGLGWSCNSAGQMVTCTTNANLEPNSSSTVQVLANVVGSGAGTVTNTASVRGGNDANCPATARCKATADLTIEAPALAISKTLATAQPLRPGGMASYQLRVSNMAAVAPTYGQITVTDVLPAGLTYASATGAGWTCGAAAQTLTCTSTAVLGAGETSAIDLTVGVAADAPATITNTASVAGGGADCTGAACSSSVTASVQAPLLGISKTLTTASPLHAGGTASYQLAVRNNAVLAPTAGGITVTDSLPTGLTPTSAAGTGWTCDIAAPTVTCTFATALGPNSAAPVITVQANVLPTAPATLTNTAQVAGGGDLLCVAGDAAPARCKASAEAAVQAPQLKLAKALTTATPLLPGGTAAYTLTVSNTATSAPTAGTITVTDILPAGLTPGQPTGEGWACSVNGQTVDCTLPGPINAGATAPVITVPATVLATASGTLTNTATVSGGSDALCPATVARCQSSAAADVEAPQLQLRKALTTPTPLLPGGTASYTLAVSNIAKAAATTGTITVIDTFPAGLEPQAPTVPAGGWACSVEGQTVRCTTSTAIAAGAAAAVITVPAKVLVDAPASVTNTAVVSGGGDATCPAADRCQASVSATVQAPALQLAKVLTTPAPLQVGGTASYTITVSNTALTAPTAGAITVTDTFPEGLTPTAATGATPGAGAGWACQITEQTVRCTLADAIAAQGSAPAITVVGTVLATASSPLANRAQVSGGGDAACPADARCNASAEAAVVAPALQLAKTLASTAPLQPKGTASYQLLVSNTSQTTATSGTITVTDTFPAGLTPTEASGSGWACRIDGQVLACTSYAVLAAGAAAPAITAQATVLADAPETVVNTAQASGGGDAGCPAALRCQASASASVTKPVASAVAVPLLGWPGLLLMALGVGGLAVWQRRRAVC